MKKTILILSIAAFGLVSIQANAQDKTATAQPSEQQAAENLKKEADALEVRIRQYTMKVEANKDNANVDYESEAARLSEWKAKWESMTGKTWVEKKETK